MVIAAYNGCYSLMATIARFRPVPILNGLRKRFIGGMEVPSIYEAYKVVPPNYKWVIIPLVIDISPTKTMVKWDLCSPTER